MASDARENAPPLDSPSGEGMETRDPKDVLRNDSREAPVNPETSGAPIGGSNDTQSPAANRNPEGPRQAGITPRPTDRPIG